MLSQIDLAHSPGAKRSPNYVAGENFTWLQRHRRSLQTCERAVVGSSELSGTPRAWIQAGRLTSHEGSRMRKTLLRTQSRG
jgi:hypothetical protein